MEQGARPSPPRRVLLWRSLLRAVSGLAVLAACLFGASGDLAWTSAWVYLAVSAIGILAIVILLYRYDPDLLVERSRFHRETKRWDKALAPLVAIVLPLALLVLAGLDRRYAWGPVLPLWLGLLALVPLMAGFGLVLWAMLTNTFFATTVRIQSERGHRVVSSGPYRIVRHPGYAGAIVADLALPILLGSLWALVPATLAAACLVLRTVWEDRTLQAELAGYADYAARVRDRLIPGVW